MKIWWAWRFGMEAFLVTGSTFYFLYGIYLIIFSWRILGEFKKKVCNS